MALESFFVRYEIDGKVVYVVDDHHKALAAWAMERRKLALPPYLVTIDHHIDTCEAFSSHVAFAAYNDPSVNEEAMARELLGAIDWSSDQRVSEAISKLRHDEHIHAAIKSGTLAASFSIQLSDQDGYVEINEDCIYVIPYQCAIGCNKNVYDNECAIHHALEIIEKPYLDDQLHRISEVTSRLGIPNIESLPYILDIDLDAFHSVRAVTPDDPSTFRRLVRGALAITIATEPEWVKEVWIDDDNEPSADRLLMTTLGHIAAAMR